MAYVAFEQAPDLPVGAGIFTTDTGQKTPLVYLPQEAAQIAQQPDLRMASNDAPSFDSLAGLGGGGAPKVPPSVMDVAGAGSAAAPPLGPQFATPPAGPMGNAHSPAPPIGAPVPILPPAEVAGPTAPASGGGPPDTGSSPAMGGFVPSPPVGGSGGHSSFQKSLTHEVTPSLSPENLAATQAALKDSADTQADNLKREAEVQTHQMLHAGIQASIARDEQEQARQRATQARDSQAKWDAEWQAASKEDPTDVWHGNMFAHVLGIIGQAMGAYGASITHTDNWAAKLISQAVDQNVKVQMAKREGLYKRLRDAGQDVEQAQNAVRVAGLDAAAREAEQFAAQQKATQAGAQAAQVGVDLRKQQQAVVNENQMAEQGKTSVTTAQSGSSGGAGGGDRDAWVTATRKKMRDAGMDTTAFDKRYGVTGAGGEGDDAQTAAELRIKTPARNVLDTIQNNGPKFGLAVDPNTGEWQQSTGSALSSKVPFSTAKHAKESLVNALAPEMVKLRTGGEGDDKARTAAAEELRGLSPEQFTMTINQLSRNARHILSTKIYHGKNQVPGGDGSGEP